MNFFFCFFFPREKITLYIQKDINVYNTEIEKSTADPINSTSTWVEFVYGPTTTSINAKDLEYTKMKNFQRFILYELPLCPSTQKKWFKLHKGEYIYKILIKWV